MMNKLIYGPVAVEHRSNSGVLSMNLRVVSKTGMALILVLCFAMPLSVSAERSEGIMTEFRQTEEAIRNRQKTPEARQKTLEENLVRAVRLAIARRFHEEKGELLKDLNAQTMKYENPTSELVYYVKYKNYIVRFDFLRDPEFYLLTPSYEKFLIIGEDGVDHSADAPATDSQ